MLHKLKLPCEEASVRGLALGDTVYLSGTFCTARDEAHIHALSFAEKGNPLPVTFERGAVYHCGPIVMKKNARWELVAAGPTTSSRMNTLEPQFIARFKPAFIIGKGGMSQATVSAMREFGCCYLAATGGAVVLAAEALKNVKAVHWLEELGMPEALWVLEATEFGPLIIAIDAKGNSIYERVEKQVAENARRLRRSLGIE